ncbi:unnamed protein product [Cuscuta epithymum]|uniref:Epidermal patterning factor-like protein n=1 Tax=Cuscuta epithymum TaxID=186058 RepID=A0AAV0G401_9ASTE|nr:unnamed protein product [Cuscuta epithymum]CAH9142510.1 unnamed protein product [Cuscuta epithymum]
MMVIGNGLRCNGAVLLLLMTVGFWLLPTTHTLRPSHFAHYQGNGLHNGDQPADNKAQQDEVRKGELVYGTGGSTRPDCTHACGPCSPCKRVMVSFKCAAAESCPVVYRCSCRGKYYHVPSN